MAAREFKTIKELFIHPDAKENWNFMRFLNLIQNQERDFLSNKMRFLASLGMTMVFIER